MAIEIPMPRLSDTMEQGTVARWVKQEGDHVVAGDVIAEIDTDKATMELTAFEDGVLLKILVAEGESADLGTPIALIGAEDEQLAEHEQVPGNGPREDYPPPPSETSPEDGGSRGPQEARPRERERQEDAQGGTIDAAGEMKASPIARRMAAQTGLDLHDLGQGSGPDGRIVKIDVERALASTGRVRPPAIAPTGTGGAGAPIPAAFAEADEVVDATPMLRTVARRMTEAKTSVPHFYLDAEIDVGRALELREELNRELREEERISVNDLVVRAVAIALVEHPKFHRSWLNGKLVLHRRAHIGIAVALEDGLVVPVLRSADQKSLREIALESRDLAERARSGKLKQDEIEGGTFTVSNLGMFGIPSFTAVVNPPEPGILAVGAAVKRAVVSEEAVQIRPIMRVTLSVDHRATSGAEGAALLATIRRYLEHPVLLLA